MIPRVGEYYLIPAYGVCKILRVIERYVDVKYVNLGDGISIHWAHNLDGFHQLSPRLLTPLEVFIYDSR